MRTMDKSHDHKIAALYRFSTAKAVLRLAELGGPFFGYTRALYGV
jgi:hypothetical protein